VDLTVLADETNNALTVHTTGTQGSAISAYSQSGAPVMQLLQDTHFDNPAFMVTRSGTAGDVVYAPLALFQAGVETTGSDPIMVIGGCLSLDGDNWTVFWGDGAMSVANGFTNSRSKYIHGKTVFDPAAQQLIRLDGSHLDWETTSGSNSILTQGLGDARYTSILQALTLTSATTYTLQASDNGNVLRFSNTCTVTLPSLRVGFTVGIIQEGSGQITFTTSGTTMHQRQGFTKTAGQYAMATLVVNDTNTYVLTGDLSN
jgi:hypothetical protein